MSIFISHTSALEFWRSERAFCSADLSRAKPRAGLVPKCSAAEWLELEERGVRGAPLHLAVADAPSRSRAKNIICHVWHGPSAAKSFVRVKDNLYVSSPEACFLQMSTMLPLVKVVEMGYELCGSFALSPSNSRGFCTHEAPTTAESLRRYMAKSDGISGAKRARRALDYLTDGAASPMEAALVLLLCLPTSLGGYGLALPRLNYGIEVPVGGRSSSRRVRYRCDLYWSEAKLAVEYDSDMFHTGSKRIAGDAAKRTNLTHAGVTVVSVTRSQIFDARRFDEAAALLAKRLGGRIRSQRKDLLTKRYELRTLLFAGNPTQTESWVEGPRLYVDF